MYNDSMYDYLISHYCSSPQTSSATGNSYYGSSSFTATSSNFNWNTDMLKLFWDSTANGGKGTFDVDYNDMLDNFCIFVANDGKYYYVLENMIYDIYSNKVSDKTCYKNNKHKNIKKLDVKEVNKKCKNKKELLEEISSLNKEIQRALNLIKK